MITDRQAERLERLIGALVGARVEFAVLNMGHPYSKDAQKALSEVYRIQSRLDKHIQLMRQP